MRRVALALVSLAPLISGCGTATIEDAVPQSALNQPPAPAASEAPSAATFSQPGDYPNLNIVPRPAAPQLTEGEVEAKAAELRMRREQLSGGSAAGGDRTAELRRLAAGHADDALRQIDGR